MSASSGPRHAPRAGLSQGLVFWQGQEMVDQLEDGIASFQRCIESRDREAAEDLLHPEYALVLVQPGKAVMPRIRWLELLPD